MEPNTIGSREKVRAHILDRVTAGLGAGATVVFVLLVALGWPSLRAAAGDGRGWLLLALGVSLAIASASLVFRFLISGIVGDQISDLADVAVAIASGELTRVPAAAKQDGQLGRLARAMLKMSEELGQLGSLIRDNAKETARHSTEITGGTEHMAQAASGIAETASTLSQQASTMADTIRLLSLDAGRLNTLAGTVNTGAADGIARNQRLKSLATESHERLDESARRLDALVGDVQASAKATDSLSTASDQIRGFVSLVQKIARQSKLLALNAAMEAARAGEQGEGFTVVANEVRRLAQSAADAAEHTDQLMQGLIAQMVTARDASARSLTTVETVRSATTHGRQAFTQVEVAVAAADEWVSTMATTAAAGSTLATEITAKLDSLSAGTQNFANAMQDVAASSEEQSASTQEIAAAANALVAAADRVSGAARQIGGAQA